MPKALPVGPSDYYDLYPELTHRAGDIWSDLPSMGVLPLSQISGLVITPACDLQNYKVDSLTYLPVIPIRQAYALRGFLPDVLRALDGQFVQLGLDRVGVELNQRFVPLEPDVLNNLASDVKDLKVKGTKEKAFVKRALAAIALLQKAYGTEVGLPTGTELMEVFGEKQFRDDTARIVRNSLKPDVHFLPSDAQPREWSLITEPSVALFRYPLSIPIEILDCAQDTAKTDWDAEVSRLGNCIACATSFLARRPMKKLTLKPRFMADLTTRYVSMYARLGAPDFTEEAVKNYVSAVRET